MKTKMKMRHIIVAILCATLCLMTVVFSSTIDATAAAMDSYALDLALCKEMTANDDVTGYADMNFATYFSLLGDDSKSEYMKSDYLKGLIPEETLMNIGQYYYIGYDYSFFVETEDDGQCTESDVVIIDNSYEYEESLAQIMLCTEIYTARFRTYLPTGVASYIGKPNRNYYLRDINFGISVRNEHELNDYDEGYFKDADPGVVIRQTRLNYGGVHFYNEGNGLDVAGNVMDFCVQVVSTVFKPVGMVSTIFNMVETIGNIGESIADLFTVETKDVEANNEKNILTEMTKEAQQLNPEYVNYRKSIIVMPNEDEELFIDKYAQFIVLLSEQTEETRIDSYVSYDLCRLDGSKLEIVNHEIPVRAEDTIDNTDNRLFTKYSQIIYEQMDTAITGKNDGYLFDSQSEQIFRYIPEKNGIYDIEAEGHDFFITHVEKDKFGNEIATPIYSGERFFAGHEYKIIVKNGNLDSAGAYLLNITFRPQLLTLGDNSITVYKLQSEYYEFTPSVTGIYNFDLMEGNGLVMQLIGSNEYVSEVFLGGQVVSVYMSGGINYQISFYNSTNTNISSMVSISIGRILTENETMNIDLTLNETLTFVPAYSGEYTLNIISEDVFSCSIYDSEYNKIYSSDVVDSYVYKCYLNKSSTYYIELENWSRYSNTNICIEFTPIEVSNGVTTINNTTDYNIVKFLPAASGNYNVTVDEGEVVVYDLYGESLLTSDSVYSLIGGNAYYLKVYDKDGTLNLYIGIDSQSIVNNEEINITDGENIYMFVAPASGTYVIEGVEKFAIYDGEFKRMIYNETSSSLYLSQNETYYIYFSSDYASDVFSIEFNPIQLEYYDNILINQPTYFLITDYPGGEYTFYARAILNQTVNITLYDSNLREISSGSNSHSETLVSNIGYYLYVEIYNVDTLVYIDSTAGLLVEQREYDFSAASHIYQLEDNDKITLKIEYNGTAASAEYFLRINQGFNNQEYLSLQYKTSDGKIADIELRSNGRLGEYFCTLTKSIGTYFLTIHTAYSKEFIVDFYIPTQIEDVYINNGDKTVNLADITNSFYLGQGKIYEFDIAYNDDATFKTSKIIISADKDCFEFNNGKLYIDEFASIATVITVEIIANEGDDYRMYLFEVSEPYSASTIIANDIQQITIVDEFGLVPNSADISIEYYYSDENGYEKKINTSQNNTRLDLVPLPNYGLNIIRSHINVNGYEFDCKQSYMPTVVTTFDNINNEMFGISKIVINVENYTSSPNKNLTVNVPSNIKHIIVKGNGNFVFKYVDFVFKARTSDVILSFYNFSFETNKGAAIDIQSNVMLAFNIMSGETSICTTKKDTSTLSTYCDSNAINAYNLTINGGALTVRGGDANKLSSVHNSAGVGIYVRNELIVSDCTLKVYGGNGLNNTSSVGYYGADGGDAVKCQSVTMLASSVYLYGGSGSDGSQGNSGTTGSRGGDGIQTDNNYNAAHGGTGGSGGTGAQGCPGGDGGYGLYASGNITINIDSSIYLYGGDGGNGGTGGTGGTGGRGGDGADSHSRSGSNDAGNGGTGGRGGNGGTGGVYGDGVNGSNKTISGSNVHTYAGTDGAGGKGGKGGTGGRGGNGGDDVTNIGCEGAGGNGGRGGDGGHGYAGASGGAGGAGGAGGSIGYEGANGDNVSPGSPGASGNRG